ncbi:MAG: 50S ribosomal protein L11 methyltransferase [Actinomycetota bacterium]|nr:50S ribosomal protein L11 methyltransferase [Actinomycetota bacterium]
MLALVVTVPVSEAELAADALWSLGASAVEERDVVQDDAVVELWTSLGDDPSQVTPAADGFPGRWRWKFVEIDEDVAESWRRHAVATWVTSELVIVPAWQQLNRGPGGNVTEIAIDPGAAFGLGDHPTTVATLRALRSVQWPGASVLDVGCGSGVLGITAARFGAPRVVAVDVSPAAVEATRRNAERNGVAAVLDAGRTPVADVEGPFDIVLANILAPTLVELAADLTRLTAPGGVLIISGMLDAKYDHVVKALAPMRLVERQAGQGWVALVLRH